MQGGVIEPDGITLRLRFVGGGESLIDYTGRVLETATALCVVLIEEPRTTAPRGPRALPGHQRQLVVRLDRALGARVLVDLDTEARELLPAAGAEGAT